MGRVTVGGREYAVKEFNGRKAILAGRAIARIFRQAPSLIEDDARLRRKLADDNAVRITRSMAVHPRWKEALSTVTDEDWEKVGGTIVIPQEPDFSVRFLAAFPVAFELAETEVVKLLALLVIPDRDLADAAEAGQVDEALTTVGNTLLDEGDFGELVELAAAGADQIRATFEAKEGALGKLRALWARAQDEDETKEAPSEPPLPTEPPSPTPTPSTSTPSSSTDSPPPTDGGHDESSIEHPSASLQPSPSG